MNPRTLYLTGLGATVVAAIGGFFSPVTLVQAWHFAVLVCLQPALGSLFIIMLYQATGGRWGEKIMPAAMAARAMVPWCFLALVPVLIFLPAIYPWIRHPEIVGDRTIFLNWPFFVIRAAIYLAVFWTMSILLHRGRRLGSGGLIVFALVGYFVAIDMVMAIAPKWYSSGFPVVFMTSSVMMAMSLTVALQASVSRPDPKDIKPWRDLGNLLLTLVIFWSYVSFTQFLIIWAGNLPEEIEWYTWRGAGIWKWLTMLMAVFNLFAPFFILLSRWVKDDPRRLQRVAMLIFGSQILYTYWLIAPSLRGRGWQGMHWLDPIVLVAALAPFVARFIELHQKEGGRE